MFFIVIRCRAFGINKCTQFHEFRKNPHWREVCLPTLNIFFDLNNTLGNFREVAGFKSEQTFSKTQRRVSWSNLYNLPLIVEIHPKVCNSFGRGIVFSPSPLKLLLMLKESKLNFKLSRQEDISKRLFTIQSTISSYRLQRNEFFGRIQ